MDRRSLLERHAGAELGVGGPGLDRVRTSRVLYVLLSFLLLAPCYWQRRLQAGDLSSHIYNSWLAQCMESGRLEGLMFVRQTTNVLFDLILGGLFRVLGAEAAQRIAVSLAVLTFVWGAFALVRAASGCASWDVLPCIAILAYGWVFHAGFFNFYLSLGVCCWALAVAWKPRAWRIAAAGALFSVAYVAHALPVIWALCLLGYLWSARRMDGRQRGYLLGSSVLALVLLRVVLGQLLFVHWSPQQIALATGADQAGVFDAKYLLVVLALLMVWSVLLRKSVQRGGLRTVASRIPFQFCALSAAGVILLPTLVMLPGFHYALSMIAERMSLCVGICVCALLGVERPGAFARYAPLLVALMFFGFLYRDERILNAFEDRVEDAVARVAPGQRVVSPLSDPASRVDALAHMIDRVCVGRCFSYANYEPSSWQFRIHAVAANPYVAATFDDSFALGAGTYVVKPQDTPLYSVDLDRNGRVGLRTLEAGTRCGITQWKVLSNPAPGK